MPAQVPETLMQSRPTGSIARAGAGLVPRSALPPDSRTARSAGNDGRAAGDAGAGEMPWIVLDRAAARLGVPPWFCIAAVAALALRGLLLRQYLDSPFAHSPVGDEYHYWDWAARIASGEWRPREGFYQGPLFPYLLAVVRSALPGFGPTGLAGLQLLLNWVTALVLLVFVRRLAEERIALAAAVIALYFAPGAFFALKGVPNTLANLLLVAGLAALPRAGKPWAWRCALAGGLLGAAALAVPSGILAVAAVALFLLLRPPAGGRLAPPAVLVASALLVISPATVSNYRQDGSLTLVSSNFGTVFLQGNNPRAEGHYCRLEGFGSFVADERRAGEEIAREETGRVLAQSGISRHLFGKGLAFIRENPGAWLLLEARKACLLLGGLDVPLEFSLARERRDFLPLLWLFPAGGFAVTVLASLGLLRRETRRALLLPTMAAGAFGASCLLFYVANRYAHPFQLLLIPAAAAGLCGMPDLHGRPWRAAAVLPVLGAAAISWQWLHKPHWEVNDYLPKLSLAYEESGDPGKSVETLERMMRAAPADPTVLLLAGIAYARQGRPDSALGALDRAIGLSPENARAWYHRSAALFSLGRTEESLAGLQRALELAPGDIRAHLDYIWLLETLGRTAEIEPQWRAGLARAPFSSALHRGYAEWLKRQGRSREADDEYRKARTLAPAPAPPVQ